MQRKGFQIRIWQWGLLAAIFVFWWAMTKPGFIPAFFFSDDSQAASALRFMKPSWPL